MDAPNDRQRSLHTSTGEVPLHEYRLRAAGRAWTILHTGAVLSQTDEAHFLRELRSHLPYGVALWPAAIALAHDVASRAEAFRARRVLELGAGTGLPGIVAASLGGHVVQTDHHELAMSVCKRNGERNGVQTIEYLSWLPSSSAGKIELDDDGSHECGVSRSVVSPLQAVEKGEFLWVAHLTVARKGQGTTA